MIMARYGSVQDSTSSQVCARVSKEMIILPTCKWSIFYANGKDPVCDSS